MLLLDYRISIIVPVLNEADNIQHSLRPLQAYRQQGHEIIVVDGGSRDNTVEQATPWCDELIITQPGRALQMNSGAERARGGILFFLHADTRLPDNSLELAIQAIKHSGKVWGRFDIQLSGRHPLLSIVGLMMNVRSRLTGIATGDQCMFVRRDVFHSLHGFPAVALMEDILLSRGLLSVSRPVCLRARAITSSRRWEQNGIIRTILLMWYLRLAFFFGKQPDSLASSYSAQ